ncbi:MAG: threonine ammonia-lyase, partial [Vallitaleaceae bacterium]|nr:threonine ammonia-lyase [Vallitaleaceae bacterium]
MSEEQKFIEAKHIVDQVVRKTPLLYSYFFSEEYHSQVYLKAENLQRTGAFKIRGAYYKIFNLSEEERARGLIASSAGNHAQGVALAARECHCQATIVMPSNTPLIKVEATKSYGAHVVLHGDCYDDAYAEALRLCQENQYTFIHPFDDEAVILGQGTIGLEILEDLPDVDLVLVPIGGGGLISGVARAIKAIRPEVKIIGVEPSGAATLKTSLEKGEVTSLKEIRTIAEGVAVKKAGQLNYPIIRDYVDEIVLVSDVDIMEAFLLITEKEKLVAENAGALSV